MLTDRPYTQSKNMAKKGTFLSLRSNLSFLLSRYLAKVVFNILYNIQIYIHPICRNCQTFWNTIGGFLIKIEFQISKLVYYIALLFWLIKIAKLYEKAILFLVSTLIGNPPNQSSERAGCEQSQECRRVSNMFLAE